MKLNFIDKFWYRKNSFAYLLFPLSLMYQLVISIRYFLYKIKLFKTNSVRIPVIIVGNITVGGTGKTPLVIAIVTALKNQGFHPGIISRGYGGKSKIWPQSVTVNSDPILVGDEAVLMAKKTNMPIAVGPNRFDDAQKLIELGCNVIVSDDGLQHYALARDIEIAVVDATRGWGNGFCLPAGPLREPKKRLKSVDFVVVNGSGSHRVNANTFTMQFVIDDIININSRETLAENCMRIGDKPSIIAIAGIGNPDRFFKGVKDYLQNKTLKTKVFPDHHHFIKSDFNFVGQDEIIIMTEKDAVKCVSFVDERFYVARGHAEVDDQLLQSIIMRLNPAHK
ncbi:MAG: tetraacyldisaccharide 4'-kinase [Gammaproteobacteria bacterium]|nr:tetraacyldisaccharide 4'-kinase [Gammaproteobacteria bacterium]